MIKKNIKQKGFTLIELLIVIAIIGLLSSIVLASLSSARAKARDVKRVSELRSIEKALSIYALNNNGNVPLSIYSSFLSVPMINGSINCNDAGLKQNTQNLYDTLINAKALSSKPTEDSLGDMGYCYVYISDTVIVAGASYDNLGNDLSGKPVAAVINSKVRNSALITFLENTKTLSGYKALAGISYGNSVLINPNINLTTGVYNDLNYIPPYGNSY